MQATAEIFLSLDRYESCASVWRNKNCARENTHFVSKSHRFSILELRSERDIERSERER